MSWLTTNTYRTAVSLLFRWRDFIWFTLKQESRYWWLAVVATIGLWLARITQFNTGYENQTNIGIAIGLGLIAIPLFAAAKRFFHVFLNRNSFQIEKLPMLRLNNQDIPFDQIRPSKKQSLGGFETSVLGDDVIHFSRQLNQSLLQRDWQIDLSDRHPAKVRKLIRNHPELCFGFVASKFQEARVNRAILSNDPKFCLSSDLDERPSVRAHAGGYFQSLATNEACTSRVIAGNMNVNGSEIYPAQIDADGMFLMDLGNTSLNNHVGVSSIAITADHYLVVWRQTHRNIQDPRKIVCTGSGSADLSDFQSGRTLLETVRRGMEREITEETKLADGADPGHAAPSIFEATTVIGFFRWLERGGKPEFVGISRLNVDYMDLDPDGFEATTIAPGEQSSDVFMKGSLQNAFLLQSVESVPAVTKEMRDLYADFGISISLPLKFALLAMDDLAAHHPDTLSTILFGNT